MKSLGLGLVLFVLGWGVEARVWAFESAPVRSQHVEATLVAEPFKVVPGKSFTVALRLKMDKGWHTYWVNPGDAGYAPKITWTLPTGFTAGPIQWPTPQLISQPPLMSYGYEGEVWLLVDIMPLIADGWPVELKAHVNWLECSDVCIPGKADLTLTIPRPELVSTPAISLVGKSLTSSHPQDGDPRFTWARMALPKVYLGGDATISAEAGGDYDALEVPGDLGFPPGSHPRFIPLPTGLIENAAPQLSVRTGAGASWRVKRDANAPALPETVSGLLAGEVDGKMVGWQVDFHRVAAAPVTAPAAPFSFLVLVFAFVGGLILNLMPCVLPVLALKVLALTKRGAGVRQGLAFTAGVLVSFWVLAGILLVLRAAGEHLGWGFQLQSPPFVILSAVLFVLIGLNLFGVFEVGESLTAAGGAVRAGTGWGSFFSGALAVVVATPCTAPVMGSALGVALGQSPFVAWLIFTALGLGMAAPYLLLSANPAWLRFVPKPGAWMETFKQVLGFPMLAAAVWLVWVYGNQGGIDDAALLLCVLLVIGLAAWIYGRWGGMGRPPAVRVVAMILVYLLGTGSLTFILMRKPVPPAAVAAAPGQTDWEPFTPERLAELRAAGKPVFIDFTATWCLSCQVNLRTSLDTAEVVEKFSKLGVTRLKADWTSNDPAVTAALASYGRDSVPLYVLYGSDPNAAPQILPEILTPGIVLRALDQLGAAPTPAPVP